MAVYLVEGPKGKQLIETRTKAAAIGYVAEKEYSANVVNTTDLVKFIKEGMEVTTISAEDKPAKSEEQPKVAPKIPLGMRSAA